MPPCSKKKEKRTVSSSTKHYSDYLVGLPPPRLPSPSMYMIMGPGMFKSRVASEIMRIPPNLAAQELGLDAHCNEKVRLHF